MILIILKVQSVFFSLSHRPFSNDGQSVIKSSLEFLKAIIMIITNPIIVNPKRKNTSNETLSGVSVDIFFLH